MNDTTHKTLEVEVLNIHKGEYLSEALKRQGYPMLPSNAIINKVMTGTGATYMELNPKLSPRNSIVIEPFNLRWRTRYRHLMKYKECSRK